MEENVTLLAAFGAGLLSFISPCVLPLIPGYLSYVSGLSLDEMRGGAVVTSGGAAIAAVAPPATRRRIVLASLAFILGFSIVFVALGASASAVGQYLMSRLTILSRIAGAIIIILACTRWGSSASSGSTRRSAFRRRGGRLACWERPLSELHLRSDGHPASGPFSREFWP
jgi:cytochrome c biogenesis protein CcdA